MSYGSGVHLALLCAILPFLLRFQIPFSTVLSTVSIENFRSLGQNMGQKGNIQKDEKYLTCSYKLYNINLIFPDSFQAEVGYGICIG